MARQYTKCISRDNHIGGALVQALIAAAVVALPIVLFGGAVIPGVAVVALSAIIAYCRWWLYDRLVCLGGDRCAVGWVSKVEPPSKKSGLDMFDTDYSFNLVLYPHPEGATQEDVQDDHQQGYLIKNQLGDDWDFSGMDEGQYAYRTTAALHAEFEGAGVYDLMIACLAALPFATAATVVCAIPVIGWAVCAILGAIAAVIFVIGVIVALNDTGDPNDVDPGLGEIHTNDIFGRGADILVVKGTWVYDSAHSGWNELHPILHCQRIGTWQGGWATSGTPDIERWCAMIADAESPSTATEQQKPENQWQVHPAVDGCTPTPDRPDIR
ncbi:hypothetical protein [Nocardia nepalensis]|uniref:hypothetical protein n=1 Tax=Nocardia nepalensis TaxID=3375448 RepID=UPI003B67D2E0